MKEKEKSNWCQALRGFKFTEEELDKLAEGMGKGVLPNYLAILLHNQLLMNEKLNTLLLKK